MNGAVMAVSSREGPGRPDDLLAGSRMFERCLV